MSNSKIYNDLSEEMYNIIAKKFEQSLITQKEELKKKVVEVVGEWNDFSLEGMDKLVTSITTIFSEVEK